MNWLKFQGGEDVETGDVVRLADGSLMKVAGIAYIDGSWYVCDEETVSRGVPKGFSPVGDPAGDPALDDADSIARDVSLAPDVYCRRRLLPTDGLKAEEKRILMGRDLLERQRRLLGGRE